MQGFKKKSIFLILVGVVMPNLFLQTSKVNAGSFEAEIFCSMRDGGNDMKAAGKLLTHILKSKKEAFSKFHLNKQLHKLLNQ